ncbi:hypothetical protein GOEFS_070_00070 [Gordonia effusa NBRC 100432]|uniref:Mycothiol-dependent maleylpyruvate isomerase metal-binding domain-containing protein n=1 Tax=Gordonia effusa NBRC 100432 TaxID=1077974 RepID=H0R1H2_9ACTN|nr:maleylpyruvate isomerase family mycothiol-dependent enzyme [Gordonia effusa]GAB18923.1 hypothetical protein GOEFS_070_00070 [Gordonia effusa NBRC 100432]
MDRLAVISAQSQRLVDVLAGVDPDRRCPTCPDWSAADLLWHLTEVHLFWGAILARNILSSNELLDIQEAKPARPQSWVDLVALRTDATDKLVKELAAKGDEEPLWSWWPADQTVGFTRRMQTYEATMHRVDAELAAGLPITPIAADVAAGAIDHVVDVMWDPMPADGDYRAEAIVELVATDIDQRWLVETGRWAGSNGSGRRAVRAQSATARATVAGTVEQLALWAWTRDDQVTLAGEVDAVESIKSVVKQGI